MPTSRRTFLQSAALASPLTAQAPRPNLLFIQTDDQRFDDLGCYGNSVIRTPHIDRLAAEGVRLRNHFVTTAICCCSRASVLTGQHMLRHGIRDFETPLSAAQFHETYPAILRRNGYRTAFLGKYAIGRPDESIRHLSLPASQFDFWFGFPQSINFKQSERGQTRHLTPLMTEKAVQFLESTPANQPFCLSLNFKEPHGPWNFFDPDRRDLYKNAAISPPATYTREAFEALPAFLRTGLNGNKEGRWPQNAAEAFLDDARTCYHLVTGVDDAVGKVMEALRRTGADSNTVVIFTSDNGSMRGAHGLHGKWIAYEESIRVPMIVRDPRLRPALRGGVRRQMTLNIDIAPTLLALAGIAAPPLMQGRNLMPVVTGANAAWREDWFYEHTYNTPPSRLPIPSCEALRTRRWKYVRYTSPNPAFEQLFDLQTDPGERRNLAPLTAHKPLLERLRLRCEQSKREAASSPSPLSR
ncbi:MAG: sulfatase [Bryobacterales bacterium]|nr:sulfatase [Bryobacterales bacterium]